MKKLKSIMAFILASGLCSVMTACGDSTENSTSEPESSVSVSSAEKSSVDESSEETTAEEVTTTEEPTTEAEPPVDEGITFEMLEQIIPDFYGMDNIDEAASYILEALNISEDNINDDFSDLADIPENVMETLGIEIDGNKLVGTKKQSTYDIWNGIFYPDGYDTKLSYTYGLKENVIILGHQCNGVTVRCFHNENSDYAYEVSLNFPAIDSEEETISSYVYNIISNQYGSIYKNDKKWFNTPIGNIMIDNTAGDGTADLIMTAPDMDDEVSSKKE